LTAIEAKEALNSQPLLENALAVKHAFNESDESVVDRLLENPYW
jgi:hypothetical protein